MNVKSLFYVLIVCLPNQIISMENKQIDMGQQEDTTQTYIDSIKLLSKATEIDMSPEIISFVYYDGNYANPRTSPGLFRTNNLLVPAVEVTFIPAFPFASPNTRKLNHRKFMAEESGDTALANQLRNEIKEKVKNHQERYELLAEKYESNRQAMTNNELEIYKQMSDSRFNKIIHTRILDGIRWNHKEELYYPNISSYGKNAGQLYYTRFLDLSGEVIQGIPAPIKSARRKIKETLLLKNKLVTFDSPSRYPDELDIMWLIRNTELHQQGLTTQMVFLDQYDFGN